jgi:hypothetical protein
MNLFRSITSVVLFFAVTGSSAWAQKKVNLGDNAALRYWSAFIEMRDTAITDQQGKEMTAILGGTAAYDDSQFKELVDKNRGALELMARGTALPNCDWGLDYGMGPDTPVGYVSMAARLGRLNVLYGYHLLAVGDKDRAVNALVAGVRFSQEVANGGTLIATLVASRLLIEHLKAMDFALDSGGLSASQRSVLQMAVAQLGPDGLDWRSNMKRELEIPRRLSSQASAALDKIIPAYLGALSNPAALPELQRMIDSAPQECSGNLPNAGKVVETKQLLSDRLSETRSRLK